MTITLRTTKGTALTTAELDGNFTDLDARIYSTAAAVTTAATAAATASAAATAATAAASAASTSAAGIPALQTALTALQTALAAIRTNVVAFSTTIPFTGKTDMGVKTLTGATAFTPNMTGAVRNATVDVTLIGNGSVAPTFPGFVQDQVSGDFDISGPNDVVFFFNGYGSTPSYAVFPRLAVSGTPAPSPTPTPTPTPSPPPSSNTAPVFTAAAAITGTPTVGTASGFTSTITGTPTPTATFQWTLDGTNISGATAGTYTPVSGDTGKALRVVVTATNTVGTASSTSVSKAVVAALVTTTQIIRENTLTSGPQLVTESGDGTNGWNYTSISSAAFGNTQAYSPNMSLGTGASGEFRITLGSAHSDTATPMVAWGGDGNQNFTQNRPYEMDAGGDGGAYRTFMGGTYRNAGPASATGDVMRIKRTGTTVTWEFSRDAGSTWTVVDTVTGQTQPQLFPIVSFLGAATANNLRGVGLS